jgi:hypothetical protein
MTRSIFLALFVVILPAATATSAAPMFLSGQMGGGQRGTIGTEGLAANEPLMDDGTGTFLRLGFGGVDTLIELAGGSANLTAGPLLDIATDVPLQTTYTYANGLFTFSAEWTRPNGSIGMGSFSAPIVATEEFDTGVSTPGVVVQVTEIPNDLEGRTTSEYFVFGPGQFDASLAAFLGVSKVSNGGSFIFFLESIDGDASSVVREGGFNAPYFEISVNTVPEPALSGIMMLAATALAAWVRSGRSR